MGASVERVALAALLHDIGKFWSRTRREPPFTAQERAHFGTYDHALWSAHFAETYCGDAELTAWVRMHHHPDTREALLISLADWLSSGERREDTDIPRGKPEAATLHNVLATVGREPDGVGSKLPLVAHGDFEAGFMPSPDATASVDHYAALWDAFEQDIAFLDMAAAPLATWQSLMRRYCSRVPAATPTRYKGFVPDINLYDHSRAVAALAACFQADEVDEDRLRALRTGWVASGDQSDGILAEPLCQLACGTLSGIQEFLYTITSKYAAKTLRGRSFALQLIADACARELCIRSGVPECCLVYNGGGRFYALLPLAADVTGFSEELSTRVHRHFAGQVSLHVGAVPLSASDFAHGRFTQRWHDAGIEAARLKRRKYSQLAETDYDAVFGFIDEGGLEKRCTVCGREEAVESTEDGVLCGGCAHYRDLGQALRNARWLVRTTPSPKPEGLNQFCAGFGYEVCLVADRGPVPDGVIDAVQLNGFTPRSTVEKLRLNQSAALGYRFVAQNWPRDGQGRIQTFEAIAGNAQGVKKLGVLRADVDNLGALFAQGLGENATISRVASLSAALSDFFDGWLNHRVATSFPETVGIIYAGGDDLFVVGAWDAVIKFALALRDDFSRFCGDNPALTFSGGVQVVDDHLPLRHAAEITQSAEEVAKEYARDGLAKNALTLFDTPVGFEELGRFTAFKDVLERMLTDDERPMPAGFLRRLFEIWEAYCNERKLIEDREKALPLETVKARARWQRWRWHLAYGLRGFARKHPHWKDEVEDIQRRLLDERESIEDRLGVPLRWTELQIRKEG